MKSRHECVTYQDKLNEDMTGSINRLKLISNKIVAQTLYFYYFCMAVCTLYVESSFDHRFIVTLPSPGPQRYLWPVPIRGLGQGVCIDQRHEGQVIAASEEHYTLSVSGRVITRGLSDIGARWPPPTCLVTRSGTGELETASLSTLENFYSEIIWVAQLWLHE